MTDKRNELAKRHESRIAAWGDRDEVREIARRVQLMAPGARKLNENEALALAQGAVAHGLDPFNGEIWYIPGSGLMAGIKGLRKAARQQVEGNYWCEFEEIVNQDERTRWDIPLGSLAYRCVLRDTETIMAWSGSFKNMNEQNVPIEVILEVLGAKPYTVGIGYADKTEKSRMTTVQLAMKRAEADATKRRFDLPFAFGGKTDEVIDVPWTETEVDSHPDVVPPAAVEEGDEEPPDEGEDPQAALYQEERKEPSVKRLENQWETKVLDVLLALSLVKAKQHATATLNHSIFRTTVPYGELSSVDAVAWVLCRDEMKKSDPNGDTVSWSLAADSAYPSFKSQAADMIADLEDIPF